MKVYLVENNKGETVLVFKDKGIALKYVGRHNRQYNVNYKVVERLVF